MIHAQYVSKLSATPTVWPIVSVMDSVPDWVSSAEVETNVVKYVRERARTVNLEVETKRIVRSDRTTDELRRSLPKIEVHGSNVSLKTEKLQHTTRATVVKPFSFYGLNTVWTPLGSARPLDWVGHSNGEQAVREILKNQVADRQRRRCQTVQYTPVLCQRADDEEKRSEEELLAQIRRRRIARLRGAMSGK